MRTYRLHTQLWLPRPRQEIFNFFSDPTNLERITPPWLRFKILTLQPIDMKVGTRLDYRLRLRGIPLRWQSEIAVWEPPDRFIDKQTRGPYTLWVHEHTFTDHKSGTLVGDGVLYAILGGKLIQKFLVQPDLERIFRYRHQVLQKIFNPSDAISSPQC